MNKDVDFKELIRKYLDGDINALQTLLSHTQTQVFNLSVRMLFSKEDAEDATQDILIRIVNGLHQFRGDSQFSTWVYAVARNYLISAKKKKAEAQEISFELMGYDLQRTIPDRTNPADEYINLIATADLKVGCTQAMLLCLNREQRLIFILSKIYKINSIEGAQIFSVSPQTYRKRLSRITQKMQSFLQENCGLINPSATCRCQKRLPYAVEMKRVNPSKPYFLEPYAGKEQVEKILSAMEKFDDESHIFRTNPEYQFCERKIHEIISSIEL